MQNRIPIVIALLILRTAQGIAQANCAVTSVGYRPLPELGTGMYKGYPGGLYQNGQNVPTAHHLTLGMALSSEVRPLSTSGFPDAVNGKIVLLSIGMSNATQEFSVFKTMADTDRVKNPRLTIVDGAQGGQTASAISNPNANFWAVVEQRLASAGVTAQQVQVAWVKEANAGPTQAFPVHAQMLQSNYESIARILKSKYPNIKIAYYSSRTYAGYAQGVSTLNPEPYAYESGFAVKWLIEKQIDGDPALTPTGSNPQAPWLAWGPYLWADGMTPRGSDGLIWTCSDVGSDGTHPSTSGRVKVANLLLTFFRTDPTATPWFLRSATSAESDLLDPPVQLLLEQNFPNPCNPSTVIRYHVHSTGRVTLKVLNLLGQEVALLVDGHHRPGSYSVEWQARGIASGVYVYRIETGDARESKRLVVLR